MGVLDSIKNAIGLGDETYEEGFDVLTDDSIEEEEEVRSSFGRKNKVVNIHATTQLKVVVMQPENFEDAKGIADHLKTKKPVIINLEELDTDVARRVVDFLSGSVYGLDGNIQKISAGIFLIAPYNVSIMGDFKDELKNKGLFSSWNS